MDGRLNKKKRNNKGRFERERIRLNLPFIVAIIDAIRKTERVETKNDVNGSSNKCSKYLQRWLSSIKRLVPVPNKHCGTHTYHTY